MQFNKILIFNFRHIIYNIIKIKPTITIFGYILNKLRLDHSKGLGWPLNTISKRNCILLDNESYYMFEASQIPVSWFASAKMNGKLFVLIIYLFLSKIYILLCVIKNIICSFTCSCRYSACANYNRFFTEVFFKYLIAVILIFKLSVKIFQQNSPFHIAYIIL